MIFDHLKIVLIMAGVLFVLFALLLGVAYVVGSAA
jgi:hypothetical protein